MKLVVIFGPPAVGKMTVGQELARRTGLRLLHNHMTIKLELTLRANTTPRDDEVLVKVQAASINPWDWDLLRGTPFLARLMGGGLGRPNNKILGTDVAGRIEALAKTSTGFSQVMRCTRFR